MRCGGAKHAPCWYICLGMQPALMNLKSMDRLGLGITYNWHREKPFLANPGLAIHMGWNQNTLCRKDSASMYLDKYTYFCAPITWMILSIYYNNCRLWIKVPGIVEKGNVYGMQFHPREKAEL